MRFAWSRSSCVRLWLFVDQRRRKLSAACHCLPTCFDPCSEASRMKLAAEKRTVTARPGWGGVGEGDVEGEGRGWQLTGEGEEVEREDAAAIHLIDEWSWI